MTPPLHAFDRKIRHQATEGIYPRQRLFARLTDHPGSWWVSGPAGSGKTSLAASWLANNGLPHLWCRMDAENADPAIFFAHIAAAAADLLPKGHTLPRFTPEEATSPTAFSQRFFQALDQGLPGPAILVLDDYHTLPGHTPLPYLLQAGWPQLREGSRLLVLSRETPTPPFAEWLEREQLRQMAWADLRLSLEECRGLVRTIGGKRLDNATIDTLYWKSDGWTAGIFLLLEQDNIANDETARPEEANPQEIFNYFARQVLNGVTDNQREILFASAAFPAATASMVADLTGRERVAQTLAEILRKHLFITRVVTPGQEGIYRLHDLFRAFLRATARTVMGHERHDAQLRKAAEILETHEWWDDAIQLWGEAGQWDEVIRLTLRHAPALAMEARLATIERWLAKLPPALLETNRWLAYWQGTAITFARPDEARRWLHAAFRWFEERQEWHAAWMCWCGVVEIFQVNLQEIRALLEWLHPFEALRQASGGELPPDLEARILGNRLFIAFFQPSLPEVLAIRERLLQLAPATPNLLRATIYTAMLMHGSTHGHFVHFRQIEPQLRDWFMRETLPPMLHIHAQSLLGIICLFGARMREAIQLEEAAWPVVERYGLLAAMPAFRMFTGQLALAMERYDRVAKVVNRFRPAPGTPPMECSFHYYLSALLDFAHSRFAMMRHNITLAIESDEGLEHTHTYINHLYLAQSLYALGENEQAAAVQERTLAAIRQADAQIALLRHHQLMTLLAMEENRRAEAVESLRAAVRLMRLHDHRQFGGWGPGKFNILSRLALEEGIETEFVREIVRDMGLPPEPEAQMVEAWPWPVRIRAFGGLEIEVDGTKVALKGKIQAKPMELLKLLLARNGRKVASTALADHLWPDAEGDAAMTAFNTTLHRLRKLLGRNEAILLGDGEASLNPECCQVDLWAMEHLSARIEATLKHAPGDYAALERLENRLLATATGPFLASEGKAAWVQPAREQWRSRILQLLTRIGEHLESKDRHEAAERCYQRGLEFDPLAESLHRRLMRCLAHQGRHSEAAGVYRRCRSMLSVVLGMQPSPETERLFQSIRNAGG
ncbi:MAG: winged helix-turn-helix domain-containing protein [Magnetococcales bacterium]|nr:winged helix-turn-helix domain-containing protein [Magnetococcales bacterium]